MKPTSSRFFVAFRALQHENPLGLPRTGSIPRMQRGLPEKRKIPNVAKIVAVSSAKGGVGKSTVAANLALAFARMGHRAGILDTDIFGPSIPTLFNLSDEPRLSSNNQLIPLSNYGVKTMSMGYLVPPESPIVWRGMMVMKALQQLLHEVDWSASSGGLDVLVLDLPPGTGDTQLSIVQQVELDGSVIVTTPHALALADARRGIAMFRKTGIPVLGLVDNMSVFVCPGCETPHRIFGDRTGLDSLCAEEGAVSAEGAKRLEILGEVPLHQAVGDDAQRGKPTVAAEPTDSPRVKVFMDMAQKIGQKIGLASP